MAQLLSTEARNARKAYAAKCTSQSFHYAGCSVLTCTACGNLAVWHTGYSGGK